MLVTVLREVRLWKALPHNARFQPRRRMSALAAVGCKSLLGRRGPICSAAPHGVRTARLVRTAAEAVLAVIEALPAALLREAFGGGAWVLLAVTLSFR